MTTIERLVSEHNITFTALVNSIAEAYRKADCTYCLAHDIRELCDTLNGDSVCTAWVRVVQTRFKERTLINESKQGGVF